MKLIVISRVSDVRRRQNVARLLNNCDLEWQFLDAYEAGSIPQWFSALYDEGKARRYRSYALVPGEKGCFSSHMAVWIKCVDSNESIVVLEDDCELLDGFFARLKEIDDSGFDYVKLEKRSDGKEIDTTFMVNDKNRSATTGYYVSPRGAGKFLSALSPIYMPVDHYIGMSWRHGVAPIGLIEPIVTNDAQFGTLIQGDRKKGEKANKRNKWLRLLRKVRRYIDNVRYRRFIKQYMGRLAG